MTAQTTKPTVTTEVVKAQLNVALTSANIFIQKMQDEANKLEINEDNLQAIADFIAKTKKADDIIEENHKSIKAPYWAAGKACDYAKADLIKIIEGIRLPIHTKYTKISQDIESRKKQEFIRQEKEKQILRGIESNVISFSNKIAACSTIEELLSVERLINLEKSPSGKVKYGEFHAKAIDRYEEILKPAISSQKQKIKEAKDLKKQLEAAQSNNNLEEIEAVQEKQEQVQREITQNQINVQEQALNQSPIETFTPVETIYPTVKARRTSYEIELVDVEAALKKAKGLLSIELNKEAAKMVLETLKEQGQFDDKDEVVVNGIKYFKKVTY